MMFMWVDTMVLFLIFGDSLLRRCKITPKGSVLKSGRRLRWTAAMQERLLINRLSPNKDCRTLPHFVQGSVCSGNDWNPGSFWP